MRIIAGEYRGRVLRAPQGRDTRPTTDRVRESVMSSVFSATGGFDGLCVLDAFAGSGAMGLEALSRGAAFVLLNDGAADARRVLQDNVDALGCTAAQARVTSFDVLAGGLPRQGAPFDLVFLDPPYKTPQGDVLAMVSSAREGGLLSEECLVVYEHDEPADGAALGRLGLALANERRLGKTYVSYILPS